MIQKLELGFLVMSLIQMVSLRLTGLDQRFLFELHLISPLICLISAISFYLAYRNSASFTRQAAAPWLLISGALLILSAGDFFAEFQLSTYLSWLIQNILFRSFFLIGILQFPRAKTTRPAFFQDLADFVIILMAVGFMYWTFLLMPLLSADLPGRSLALLASLLDPLLNTAILWVLARLSTQIFQHARFGSPRLFLVLGFSFYFVTNAMGSFQNLTGGLSIAQINFTALAAVLLGMAGFEQARLISLQIISGPADLVASSSPLEVGAHQTAMIPQTDDSLANGIANLVSAYTVMNPYLRDVILYVRMRDQQILAVNLAAELEYGYSNEEMLQLHISDLRSPDSLAQIDGQMQQANQDGILFETRHRRKDGSIFPVEVRASKGEYFGENCNISIVRNISEREKFNLEIRAAYQQFEKTFASLEDVVFVQSPFQFDIVLMNAACERLLGYAPEALIGNTSEILFASRDDFEYIRQTFEKAIREKGKFQTETRIKARDGRLLLAEFSLVEILDDSNQRVGIVGIIHDITARRKAEIRSFKSQSRYEALFKNMQEGLALLEYKILERNYPRFYFLEANQAFFNQAGITREQAEGQELSLILPGGDPQWADLGVRIAVRGEPFFFEEYVSPLGKIFLINAFSLDGGIIALLLMDVTQQRSGEKKLQDLADRLQALSRRLINIQEEERRHLGRELHDEIGQVLTGLKFTIEASLARLPASGKDSALASVTIINDLIVQVREISRRLRPAMLDDFGLIPALTSLCDRLGKYSELEINFEHTGLEARLPFEIETGAYRIAQEGLTNIIRHAGARQAAISIRRSLDQLEIEIDDNGKGFVVDDVLSTTQSLGLTGIFERASLLNGVLTIDSKPGQGTHIKVWLPVAEWQIKDELK